MDAKINYEEEFRKHWRWMAETGATETRMYFEANKVPAAENYCFSCQFHNEKYGEDADCAGTCPTEWPSDTCLRYPSPFLDWYVSNTVNDRKHYARIISELPWVEKPT